MIKIDNVEVLGWEHAIRGMRNPMNSWDKSDSEYGCSDRKGCLRGCEDWYDCHGEFAEYVLGKNDMALAKKLADAGPVHGKFMRMITVYMDITAPLYWWSEYDTYKVGTVANSCSKMHKLLHKPFEMSDFSFDQLPGYKREVKHFRPPIDESTESWRKIDRDYWVSSQGRVRHLKRILSGSVHNDHYIFVTIHGKQQPVHRLVAKMFVNNDEGKPEVNHIDGNKMNNCADNLEWVTRSENQKHAVETKLQPKATTTYKGKFTAEERAEIKRLYDCGMHSKRQLAKMYGVSHTCINDILNDKYKYIETVNVFEEVARPIVDTLNEMRDLYLACDDEAQKKEIWYSILQVLPESYNQKRTVMLNYEVLRNMYHSRKNHKLDEWRTKSVWKKKCRSGWKKNAVMKMYTVKWIRYAGTHSMRWKGCVPAFTGWKGRCAVMDELTLKALEKLQLYKKYLTGPEYRTLKEKILNGELALEAKGGKQDA